MAACRFVLLLSCEQQTFINKHVQNIQFTVRSITIILYTVLYLFIYLIFVFSCSNYSYVLFLIISTILFIFNCITPNQRFTHNYCNLILTDLMGKGPKSHCVCRHFGDWHKMGKSRLRNLFPSRKSDFWLSYSFIYFPKSKILNSEFPLSLNAA